MELFFAFILIVFTLVAIAIILRSRRNAAPAWKPEDTPVAMQAVWDEWLARETADTEEQARRDTLWNDVPQPTREHVLNDLLQFEQRLDNAGQPLMVIRREIMDSVDRRMLNQEILALPPELKQRLRDASADTLQSDADAWLYIGANELRMEILREYAARRFGDRADNDWFAVYQKASRMKRRSARHFLTRSLSGELHEAEDSRQQAISMVDGALRTRLLEVRPGTEFKGLDDSHPD